MKLFNETESKGKKEASRTLLFRFYGSDKEKISWGQIISDKQLVEQLYADSEVLEKINKHWKEPLSTLLSIVHYRKGGHRK